MDLEDNNIEIITVSSSNPSHEQTPVAAASPAASSVPQAESRGLDEMTPQRLNSLKEQVCEYAREDKWKEAEPIFNKHPDMVRISLTEKQYIALHVAVEANSITFVKGLVNLMTPLDLEIQDIWGYTAFHMVVESGNSDLVQIMIEKNENLPLIKLPSDGMLPVNWAAIRGYHKIVKHVSSKTLLQKMDSADIEELFFRTIEHDMFDVATKVFEECPAKLATARDGTALAGLLRKPSKELSTKEGNNRGASSVESLQLFKKVWLQLRTQLKSEEELASIGRSSSLVSAMADALESGNVEPVKWLLSMNPKLLLIDEKNILLRCAVRDRQRSIVSLIFKIGAPKDILLVVDDDYGNNVLHYAAYPLEKEETSSTVKATTKMTSEVKWFKEVENNVPRELRKMRNGEGMTPKEIFVDKHEDLSREIKNIAKGIAESGMLVAALVATVAFAAALTVPGDKTNPSFTVFILANAAALLTSSASILSFLSNFTTSKFADSEFVIALHPSLNLGLLLLFISIVTMLISFGAASFLIFEHTTKWAAYLVASMGVFPILLFLLFQFSIFDECLWSRFYRMH